MKIEDLRNQFISTAPLLRSLRISAIDKLVCVHEALTKTVFPHLVAKEKAGASALLKLTKRVIDDYEQAAEHIEEYPLIFIDTVKACSMFQAVGDVSNVKPDIQLIEDADADFKKGATNGQAPLQYSELE